MKIRDVAISPTSPIINVTYLLGKFSHMTKVTLVIPRKFKPDYCCYCNIKLYLDPASSPGYSLLLNVVIPE